MFERSLTVAEVVTCSSTCGQVFQRHRIDEATQVLLEAAFADHVAVVAMLGGIRESADDFVAPEWACTSFRTLYSQLHWLELDVFALIHLENYVIRPRLPAGAS